ncbi:hypothetical protein Marky_2205 [Marinithermus hydrothermalis DSM 14884]|uniref:MULE transposase, conserved domain protein n=1 Tax=Marinithermus hydrothermalis (strain DSM 14884 / JCM 11576 / T1) TaxID=869210 RepID=F2NKZ0_MARHT|nr:hypothetical protein Marky_0325 [Marinithermus hydrothermalis DSM 14884]AEB11179.1 hypothetical protein Marky_0427 [Marinithermus hydrothermalis DSM 14884]AEB11542.1 hypothetical protein Marky_0794 [Marinithermus hydrothermalis DSM 14884]AEB11595.1 hypothetical protein Marky_0849 [Marinithermus hydrothermalis DSM 14884]AEB11671.1 hypothetical protein Marky_0926 [Marinithermus hydrothermalis DSM 14884]
MKPTEDSPSSIVPCPHCGATREESGGYRRRKLRTFRGIQEVRVKRIRCAQCKRQKRALYPEDCPRSRWYAISIQEHFLILASHRAPESVQNDLAKNLGFPLTRPTRLRWLRSAGARAKRLLQRENRLLRGRVYWGSVDEWAFGRGPKGYGYLYFEAWTGCPLWGDLGHRRRYERVRELLWRLPPRLGVVSDGAQEVGEALGWLGRRLLWARCAFHLMREVRAKVDRKAWGEIREGLRVLRGLGPGEREAFFWKELLPRWGKALEGWVRAWEGLQEAWGAEVPPPWTNNVAEVGHGRLWRRRRRRVLRSLEVGESWLMVGLYRMRHRRIGEKSPWERLTGTLSPECWWRPLVGRIKGSTQNLHLPHIPHKPSPPPPGGQRPRA